jgi:molybdopterin-guanine dinucleotide biosynthesis protein A
MSGESSRQLRPAISVVVLAGGESRRLGVTKAFLEMEGKPLVAHTVGRLSALSSDLIIVTNDSEPYRRLGLGARLVPDERQGVGSLMGIYSGLRAAHHYHALVVACDMPFLSLPLLHYMTGLVEGQDVVIPRMGRWFEPLHAIYSKDCLGPIARLLEKNRRRIMSFFPDVHVRHVERDEIDRFDPERRSFLNINTPADWERVQDLLDRSG